MAALGLTIGIAALVAVVLLIAALYLRSRRRGVQMGTRRILRCSEGHLFTTTFIPGASVKALRLGTSRYQHCPVGNHWSLVQSVDPATLTPEERARAEAAKSGRLP